MSYTTEIFRRVYDDVNGAFIEIRPGTDGFGVQMSTPDKASSEYWGAFRVTLPKDMARQLGEALLAASNEVDE